MEKISGILPSSSRVSTVDLRSSGAVRPGAPSFGREQGESNLMKNSIVRSTNSAIQRHNELMEARVGDKERVEIVSNMADNFFKRKAQRDLESHLINDIVNSQPALPIQQPEVVAAPAPAPVEIGMDSEENLDAPEVGRFLDVSA